MSEPAATDIDARVTAGSHFLPEPDVSPVRNSTASAFMTRAIEHFTTLGVTIARVLTDNGSCYRSRQFGSVLADHGIAHKKTRPYRPQTNGKVERFNRTAVEEWSYARPYTSEHERIEAYPAFLHTYNHERGHTALNGASPASRVTNLPGQNTVWHHGNCGTSGCVAR